MMNNSKVKWLSPVQFWPDLNKISKPQILQFSSDAFMEELIKKLQTDHSHITEFCARKETWRGPLDVKLPLKLYQPAHQRHYLVTAALVCQIPGFPDRRIDSGRQERVSFVVRRLIPNLTGINEEYALVNNSGAYCWTKVVGKEQQTSADVLAPEEELVPMFAINYTHTDEYRRRIWAGTIPVGKREIYENSIRETISANNETEKNDKSDKSKAQLALFMNDVIAPWGNLILSAVAMGSLSTGEKFDDKEPSQYELIEQLKDCRDQIQAASWYILLDFNRYLDKYLNNVWNAIKNNTPNILKMDSEKQLYNHLCNITITKSIDTRDILSELKEGTGLGCADNMGDALKKVSEFMLKLEQVITSYKRGEDVENKWPNFLFPLADPLGKEGNILTNLDLEKLIGYIENALKEVKPTESAPEIPLAAQLSEKSDFEAGGGLYIIRCVYQRPRCQPLPTDLLSDATEPFKMASFFDVDAPARPIRITLPENPTPAGLRKYAKNTAFIMSDVLCGQVAAIRKVTFGDLVRSVLPWPFHKDLSAKIGKIKSCSDISNSKGSICSLSIPIVTICAMFLLIMIVLVLDFIFRWVPFLISCFPIKKK